MTENKEDVRRPSHYELKGVEPYQSIDFIEAILGKEGFIKYCQGSCLKYLVRAGKKDDMKKDFEKARVYLDWIIERVD